MSQVIVVNNSLNIANNLCDILEKRDVTVIKAGVGSSKPDFFGIDLVGYQADTVVCSDIFEKEIGGSSKLVSIARQAKLTKIIVIADDSNCNGIEIKDELGGAVKRINIADYTDQYSLELIFNTCCPNISFSAGDTKTYELLSLARRVASTDVTVFINGPTGSGKEVLANYLHENSNRKEEPFVAVNCAAIPENMLEAILFGHEKGAFTGASNANKGIFRAADKGTLLLDEISEMPLSLQAKLLRVLQERKVTPVGGQRDIDVDVRVLATSNRDMAISLLDVAKTLTSTSMSLCPPTGVTFLSCNTLSNFACKDKGISEISSKSKVPLSAALKIPLFAFEAPVKAPFSWPKRIASNMFSGIAAQLTATNGSSFLFEFSWR